MTQPQPPTEAQRHADAFVSAAIDLMASIDANARMERRSFDVLLEILPTRERQLTFAASLEACGLIPMQWLEDMAGRR